MSVVKDICSLKQICTQSGGLRPFGVSLLIGGIDDNNVPKLYETDPTGIYFEYKASVIGEGEIEMEEILHKEYDANMTVEDGLKLCLTSLKKILGNNFQIGRIDDAFEIVLPQGTNTTWSTKAGNYTKTTTSTDQFTKCSDNDNPDEIPGIFKDPTAIEGSIDAVNKLAASGKYELFIATTTPWGNPEAAMHKRLWVQDHFDDMFKKKMFLTHRKDLLLGDFLIDDREANGANNFNGVLLPFGWAYEKKEWNEYRTWDDILKRLLDDE